MTNEEGETNIEVEMPMIKFIGGIGIFFICDRGETFEILQKNMIPESVTEDDLYQLACENLARDISFRVEKTWCVQGQI